MNRKQTLTWIKRKQDTRNAIRWATLIEHHIKRIFPIKDN